MTDLVAGFDLSLTGTGYVFLSMDNSLQLVGTLTNKLSGMERCYYVRDMVLKLCRTKLVNLKYICMEGYSFGSRGMLADLGELGGLVKEVFDVRLELPYTIVGPTQLKKFATGKGSGKKNVVMMKVYKKYGVEFDDDNQCDAFVLAKIAQAIIYDDVKLDKPQKEVIDKLRGKGGDSIGYRQSNKVEQAIHFD
jgi:crossover junction endodeoxyribonuclease RuvC